MPVVDAMRTYLQLRTPDDLRPGTVADPSMRVVSAPGDVATFRALYREIGSPHHWHDRNEWSDDALHAHLASADVQLLVLQHDGDSAGFAELRRHADGSVEIAYFGVRERSQGRGFGKHLLTEAARAAWAMGATRVWLHTCTLDSPVAIVNYRARGFQPYRVETYRETIHESA